MKYITKLWSRILISIFSGSVLVELYVINTGNTNVQGSGILIFILAGLVYFFLTAIVYFQRYKYYFFPPKDSKNELGDDILDDELIGK